MSEPLTLEALDVLLCDVWDKCGGEAINTLLMRRETRDALLKGISRARRRHNRRQMMQRRRKIGRGRW